jgi:hypothetical protein
MATQWDNGTYEITFSGISPKYLSPFKFKLKREPPNVAQPAFYKVVLEPTPNPPPPPGSPPNPFKDCALLLQPGRQPTLFLRDDEKLVGPTPSAADYQRVTDLIVNYVLEEDPYSYERLVGVIPNPDNPALPPVPVTFYKLDRLHKSPGRVLLLVQAVIAPGAANGSIAVMS